MSDDATVYGLPIQEQPDNGWVVDYDYLIRVQKVAQIEHGEDVSLEGVQAVLLAHTALSRPAPEPEPEEKYPLMKEARDGLDEVVATMSDKELRELEEPEDFDPLGPIEEMPEQVQRDIETERAQNNRERVPEEGGAEEPQDQGEEKR
jgi:hypothetical protein